ncbi:integrase [Clostridia bacterium]|nr:integrase [Clostridia bacterium]
MREAMQRAALYIRVSTEEQALHGYSLEAQRETLTEYAEAHGMRIVDYYVDEGFSARKKYTNRKAFMRMLDDVRHNKIDLILFIKLDRWFRSVKDYYKIQEILEAHNVGWKTTEENYDTTTTNGRLYINIRLSVAQDESDRTADRIKYVFDSKIARGEVVSGAQPMGLIIRDKHLVHDPEKAGIVRDLFDHYATHQSQYGTIVYIHEKYGITIERGVFSNMLKNPLYKGCYRGNLNYCEPIIEPALFDKVQALVKSRGVRHAPTGRVYIFSGLIKCWHCGRTLDGRHAWHNRDYYHYRCHYGASTSLCPNNRCLNENYIEQWLLDNIEGEINAYMTEYTSKISKSTKPAVDRARIKKKLTKLKELYVNDLISLEDYRADYDRYNEQLAEVPAPENVPPDAAVLKPFLSGDFRSTYALLDRNKRQALWRGVIREIGVDSAKNINIIFR